jgi:hypothetical protein
MNDDEENISESSLLNQKQFSENINNITYVIKLGIINNDKYQNSIYLNCTPKEISQNSVEYYLIISLKKLIEKSNKMFNNCSTIQEAYENIIYIFNNKTYFLKKEKDILILTLKYNLFGKEIETELQLSMKYINKIKLLELENKKLKKEIKSLKKELSTKNEKLKILKTVNDDLSKQLYSLQDNTILNNSNIIIQTKIIKDLNDLNFVIAHLKSTDLIYNKKVLYFNLLFRASEVGEDKFDQTLGAIFNNKLFDFVLIKTKKNNIFGYKYHPYMFRFSINLKKIYVFDNKREIHEALINGHEVSLQCHYFISIFKKYATLGGICRKGMKLHYTNVDYDFEFNNGEQRFLIDEMEVFNIRP